MRTLASRPAASIALGSLITVFAFGSGAALAFASEKVSDTTISGPDSSSFGATASQVSCDVNGNGTPDLAVGLYATFDSSPGATGAYVFLDPASDISGAADELTPIRIHDSESNSMGGLDVRCAGDANDDGFDDLVAVAQGHAAYFIPGSANFADVSVDELKGVTVLGSITRANGVGDIDGDGIDEVAVTDTSGDVTVLNLDQLTDVVNLADTPGPRISGEGIDLVSVSRAGDMNGDGREDLAVGAASWTAPGAEAMGTGAVWIITDLSHDVTVGANAIPGFRIDGPPRVYDLMGTSTVGLGDIDGSGHASLMIGGESDAPKSGSALLVTGGADGVNVAANPLATDGPAVRSADGTQRGWWINGMASDDHFGHAVGAVPMKGWALLLIGGMDGSPDPAREHSGYVVAVDTRTLVDGTAPLTKSGVLDTANLTEAGATGVDLIIGEQADQRLGRSFADLTSDRTGSRVTFAVGAPALFSWETVPSVRILSFDVPAVIHEPDPVPSPSSESPSPSSVETSVPSADAETQDPSASHSEDSLATTGASVMPVALLALALLLAGAAALVLRRREG